MNESIVVSLDGDTVIVSREKGEAILSLRLSHEQFHVYMAKFIGERNISLRTPEPINWHEEMAHRFGLSAYMEARDCPTCGRLVQDRGLCGRCADEKAGMR